MPETIRVAVVDDHPMLRDGVVHTLAEQSDFEVVAEGGSTADAIRIAGDHLPDLMLIDMSMPGNGLNAVSELNQRFPAVKTIVLTVMEDQDAVSAALRLGARAYVLKGISGPDLVGVLRSVHEGGSYVSPTLAAKLLSVYDETRKAMPSEDQLLSQLTAREEQILSLLGTGLSNKEIGDELDLKEKTIKHYVTNILQKLQVRNRVEAALLVQRSGVKS